MSERLVAGLVLPPAVLDAIVERTAALVLERLAPHEAEAPSEFLTVEEAAEFLRCGKQRIYDLCSDARLERYRDGARVLLRRADLVAHVRPTGNGARTASRVPR